MGVTLDVAADDRAIEDILNRMVANSVYSHGSWCRGVPSSTASPAGCGRAPGFGSFCRTNNTVALTGGKRRWALGHLPRGALACHVEAQNHQRKGSPSRRGAATNLWGC